MSLFSRYMLESPHRALVQMHHGRSYGSAPKKQALTPTQNMTAMAPKKDTLPGSERTLFVAGATAQMGRSLIKEAIERGYDKVIACSRNPPKHFDHCKIKWVQVSDKDIADPSSWADLFAKHAQPNTSVHAINLIGTSTPTPGATLDDVNVKPAVAIAEGLCKMVKSHSEVSMGHLSTIAASYLDQAENEKTLCPEAVKYCKSRQTADLTLIQTRMPVTILRPGYMYNEMQGTEVDTGHAYSPEQFAMSRVHMVLGNGEQIQQPVFSQDVITGLLNGVESGYRHLINAVGPQAMTQMEVLQFFTQLFQRSIKPVHIPYGLAEVIARNFPKGRIAPYSIAMFKMMENQKTGPLCFKDFEQLVGGPLKSMSDVYSKLDGQVLVAPGMPIGDHMKQIAVLCKDNPQAFKELSMALVKFGPSLFYQAIRSYITA